MIISLTLGGVIKNSDGLYPDKEVKQLFDLYKRNEAIEIKSAITTMLLCGNEYAVITNMNIPENRGTESVLYDLELVSDIPFVLELE